MNSIKETMLERVNDVRQGMNSLRSSDFGYLFFWQEVGALAEKECKEAWKKLQDPKGKVNVGSDDDMRALGVGDHVVTNSKLFSVVAKIAAPRTNLDVELLQNAIIKAYPNVKATRLASIVEACRLEGKAALTKRVVENVQ